MMSDKQEQELNAYLDGELDQARRQSIESWLENSEAARQRLQELRDQHHELQRLFARPHSNSQPTSARPLSPRRSFVSILVPVLTAAAGFALGVFFTKGAPQAPQPSPSNEPDWVQIDAQHGQLMVRSADDLSYLPFQPDTMKLAGSTIRTGPDAKMSFRLADGTRLRVPQESELAFEAPGKLRLHSGRVFAEVGPDALAIETDNLRFKAHSTSLEIESRYLSSSEEKEATTEVRVLDGRVSLADLNIESGFECVITGDSVGKPTRVRDMLLLTSWVHELLPYEGTDARGLEKRVREMLAELGRTKMRWLYEWEIRQLGDHAILPLFEYLKVSPVQEAKMRRKAAKLLADLCGPDELEQLLRHLDDEDPQVRLSIANALRRLTGNTILSGDDPWLDERYLKGVEGWRNWVESMRNRY